MLPRIVIVFTGGTIASTLDDGFGGVVPTLSGGEILAHIPDVRKTTDVLVHEYGTYPGPHITPDRMLELSAIVNGYVNDPTVDGVVVTHGTDTLEETAYFLDCTVGSDKPVVVIGAMRNSSEPDWDGPRNLRDAIMVAVNPAARGLGSLVVLGGDVLAASEATKTDTEDVATFTSFNFGPLGRITNNHLLLYRKPLHREIFSVKSLPTFVPLLKCFAGMDATLVDASLAAGCQGIVVEAFGAGNVTPGVYHAVAKAVDSGIPVVLVSRCPMGRVEQVYAYEGAGKQLHAAGVIFADYLNGPKARIKLMCAIGAGLGMAEIRQSFEWVDHTEVVL
ncbi:MAG: asparaginase [Bradyrhizobiaceae bacterium]|nr:asparaginase [Bradyrhizobiaceae bacterium]